MKALQRGGTWYHSMQHLHHSATYSLQLALMKWEGRPEKVRPLVILSTFRCLLWLPPEGLASSGQNLSLNWNSHQNICWCLFPTVPLIMVDDIQPCAVLEIWDLHTCAWNLRSAQSFSSKKNAQRGLVFLKTLRHCNCSGSENFWSETNRHDYVIHR